MHIKIKTVCFGKLGCKETLALDEKILLFFLITLGVNYQPNADTP